MSNRICGHLRATMITQAIVMSAEAISQAIFIRKCVYIIQRFRNSASDAPAERRARQGEGCATGRLHNPCPGVLGSGVFTRRALRARTVANPWSRGTRRCCETPATEKSRTLPARRHRPRRRPVRRRCAAPGFGVGAGRRGSRTRAQTDSCTAPHHQSMSDSALAKFCPLIIR